MPKIKVEQLQAGMRVAAEVKNMDGMLLLPAGSDLTEKHIQILQSWGVVEVNVEDTGQPLAEPANPLAQLSPDELARLSTQLQKRFWELDLNQPVQAAVFNAALRRSARKGLHG